MKYKTILILALFLSACTGTQQELTIGMIAPMTGPTAMIGESLKEGALLAIGDANLIIEDAGDAKTAVTAFQKLINEEPDAIIVATGAEAIAPLAEQYQIPIIATVTAATGIPQLGSYTFRYFTHADIDATVLAEYATDDLNLNSFAVLFEESDYGYSYDAKFTEIVEKNGGTVLAHEAFPFANQDFRTSLLKIADMHPDAIYIIGLDFEILTALGQMKETGFPEDIEILATGTITTENVVIGSGGLVDGIYSSAFCNPLPEEYVKSFKAEYGKLPDFFSLFGYDSIRMLNAAGEDIKQGLLDLGSFNGLIGKIKIDQNGETNFDMCPMQIREGKLWNLNTGERYPFVSEIA